MAIYHLHIDSYRRSRGRTAVGGMAYRRGVKVACRHSGKHYNFRGKGEVVYSDFVAVEGDKTDYTKLENLIRLYESVEQSETHCRATVGREIEAALPNELNLDQQKELILGFIQEVKQSADAERAFFDFSIHHKKGNPHVHICMAEREQLSHFDFSKTKRRHWDGKDFVKLCRQIWERLTNEALASAGINQRVDCRSHAERGVETLPTMHQGRAAYFDSEVKQMNEHIKAVNERMKQKKIEQEKLQQRTVLPDPFPDWEEQAQNQHSQPENDEPWSIVCEDDLASSAVRRQLRERYRTEFNFSKHITRIDLLNPNYAVIVFKDKSKLEDHGNRLVAIDCEARLAAYRMIELALAKQWQSVSFTGDEQFLRIAFERALDKGLDIHTKTEAQRQLLAELQRERQGVASTMSATTSSVVPLPLDAIQKKYQAPKPQSSPETQNKKAKRWRRSGG